MNHLLQVKLKYRSEQNNSRPKGRNLRSSGTVTTEHIDSLIDDLMKIKRFYLGIPKILDGVIVDVYYNDIIAKSNRIKSLFKYKGKEANDSIVGARFSDAAPGQENHIITYYIPISIIDNVIEDLNVAKKFIIDKLDGKAIPSNFNEPKNKLNYNGYGYSKSRLRDIVVDASVVEKFDIPQTSMYENKESLLVTFYKTELSVSDLFEKLKIDQIHLYFSYGENTISVNSDFCQLLLEKVPYLISMISSDFSQITREKLDLHRNDNIYIPAPQKEPTIGVIDTLFDETVYFHEWVESSVVLDEYEKYGIKDEHYEHGTAVSSIIVDGPRMNPWLDDNCGRFRVRHFGVCLDKISPSKLMRRIKDIVNANPDIHVWNLSLGTEEEVSRNFISYDASVLDQLQAEKNIIFVVAGTNDNRSKKNGLLRIGSPADSLNSLVVNAVKRDETPVSYSRKGTVLSFFNKPDVSYYGGDVKEEIKVYSSVGEVGEYGTSFAAPWISRKLCYLIDVIGLSREVAKALIIDAAAGWDYKISTYKYSDILGYGVVPIDISKVLNSPKSEIKFTLYGTSSSYKTTNYAIPVPKGDDNKYPFIARATLCYFPECTRAQGVDYTNRELSLRFGRVADDNTIKDINKNPQDEEGTPIDERQSRREFRKWENTKFISAKMKKNKSLKSYSDRLWGFSITSKERLTTSTKQDLNFGVVITLKEINDVNRIQDFITACTLRGWIVNEISMENRLELYNTNQEEIVFD